MKRLLLLFVKYLPGIQLLGVLANNTLYFYNVYTPSYTLDFLLGNSLITTILLTICSYIFKFCIWHRILIAANFVNMVIAYEDILYRFPIKEIALILIYYIVGALAVICITLIHIYNRKR